MIRLHRLDKHLDIISGILSSQGTDNQIDINKFKHGVSFFKNNTRLFNTHDALILFEKQCSPVLYIPKADIFERHFLPSDSTSYCPYKGEAHYWSLSVADEIIVDAVWEYPVPLSGVEVIENHLAFANNQQDGEFLFYDI